MEAKEKTPNVSEKIWRSRRLVGQFSSKVPYKNRPYCYLKKTPKTKQNNTETTQQKPSKKTQTNIPKRKNPKPTEKNVR